MALASNMRHSHRHNYDQFSLSEPRQIISRGAREFAARPKTELDAGNRNRRPTADGARSEGRVPFRPADERNCAARVGNAARASRTNTVRRGRTPENGRELLHGRGGRPTPLSGMRGRQDKDERTMRRSDWGHDARGQQFEQRTHGHNKLD